MPAGFGESGESLSAAGVFSFLPQPLQSLFALVTAQPLPDRSQFCRLRVQTVFVWGHYGGH